MLSWFRRCGRVVTAAVLLSLTAMGASLSLPHADDCHDAGCAALAVVHDESAHRFRAAPELEHSHPLHCAICHWTRSISPAVEAVHALSTPPERIVPVHARPGHTPRTFPAAQPPLRSPPASPVLL
ncbi:MAG TPA: hypothetical protein VIL35_08585 [Vicinamibacterales bacterium]